MVLVFFFFYFVSRHVDFFVHEWLFVCPAAFLETQLPRPKNVLM